MAPSKRSPFQSFLSFLSSSSLISLLFLLGFGVSQANAATTRSWAEASRLANITVSSLTQDEKIGLLTGLGQFHTGCIGDTHAVSPRAGLNSTPGIATNGIRSICMQDGPAGMRLTKGVSGFPTGINAAATWSRRLIRARGVAIGEEFKGKGVDVFLGPAMDIMRNPKAGRGWESAGPDPYMNGELAFETVVGVQSTGVMTCSKHYMANNQEHWRYGLSATIPSERTEREVYWYPFLRAIEANTTSIMCAYNRHNGTSSCHNGNMLAKLRSERDDEGFKGFVVSDWGATHDSASDNANAGLDMEQPGDFLLIGGGVYGTDGNGLRSAVNSGSVSKARLDEMTGNVLRAWHLLGHDDNYPAPNFSTNVHTPAHVSLNREIAGASTVLLKNLDSTISNSNSTSTRPTLPLTASSIGKIAIVGQDAAPPNQNCNDLGECNDGVVSVGWGSGTNSLEYIVPPVTALTAFLKSANPNITIVQSLSNDINAATKAINAAGGVDVILVFANAMSGELGFYDNVVGNMGDRNDLDLWYKGGSLIEAMAALKKPTIPIIHSTGPVNMAHWKDMENITAILYQGAAGEQTGWGLVDVLFESAGSGSNAGGGRNPSGRLPFTLAVSEDDYGTKIVYDGGLSGMPDIVYSEGLELDYRHIPASRTVFPFGFGLSYTNFTYSSLSLSSLPPASSVDTPFQSSASGVSVSFIIKNTGSRVGTEIAQVYLTYPDGSGEPGKVLRGFEEVKDLGVGEERTVKVDVRGLGMTVWDTGSGNWRKPGGTFKVSVAGSGGVLEEKLSGTI